MQAHKGEYWVGVLKQAGSRGAKSLGTPKVHERPFDKPFDPSTGLRAGFAQGEAQDPAAAKPDCRGIELCNTLNCIKLYHESLEYGREDYMEVAKSGIPFRFPGSFVVK